MLGCEVFEGTIIELLHFYQWSSTLLTFQLPPTVPCHPLPSSCWERPLPSSLQNALQESHHWRSRGREAFQLVWFKDIVGPGFILLFLSPVCGQLSTGLHIPPNNSPDCKVFPPHPGEWRSLLRKAKHPFPRYPYHMLTEANFEWRAHPWTHTYGRRWNWTNSGLTPRYLQQHPPKCKDYVEDVCILKI